MKTKLLLVTSFIIIGLSSSKIVLQDSGIAGYTDSPNCTSCHLGNMLNNGSGSISISTIPAFINNEYNPNTTYTLNVTVTKNGTNLFGFGFEAFNPTSINSGTLTVLNTQTKILTSGGKKNMVHTLNGGAATNSKTFSFAWIAPDNGDFVTLKAAGLAANANGQTSGDYVFTTVLDVIPSAPTSLFEIKNTSTFSVFPNPAISDITINYFSLSNQEVHFELIDFTGKIIHQQEKQLATIGDNNFKIKLPAEKLTSGLYFLKSTQGNIVKIKRLTIQNK